MSAEPGAGLFDRRGAERYPIRLVCGLRAGELLATGQCLDLSETGAAVSVGTWDRAVEEFTLVLPAAGGSVEIDCEATWVEPYRGGSIVHARFAAVPIPAAKVLAAIITTARGDFDEWQGELASRPDRGIGGGELLQGPTA